MGDTDQRQTAGSYMAESWLRKRGMDFPGRPCLVKEVGNLDTFFYFTRIPGNLKKSPE